MTRERSWILVFLLFPIIFYFKVNMSLLIRLATEQDLPPVLELWKHFCENTDLGHENVAPSLSEFTHRYMLCRVSKLPFLVTMQGSRVIGWCLIRPFHAKLDPAFMHVGVAESWVHPDFFDTKVGQMQKRELIRRLPDLNIKEILIAHKETVTPYRSQLGIDFEGATEVGTLKEMIQGNGELMDLVVSQLSLDNNLEAKL